MFKIVSKSIGLIALFALSVISSHSQNFATLPAGVPWTLAWDDSNSLSFTNFSADLFYGTNKVATLTASDLVLLGTTNSVRTFSAVVPGVPEGTNLVTLAYFDQFGRTSLPSQPLTLTVLGFPSAPQSLRKR